MSPDPLAGDIADPQSLNRYSYVGNNPLTAVDPLGADMIEIGTYNGNCGDSHVYDPVCGSDDPAWSRFTAGYAYTASGGAFWNLFSTNGKWADPETLCGAAGAVNACDNSEASNDAWFNNDPTLNTCTSSLFGVKTDAFKMANQGSAGTFTGTGTITATSTTNSLTPHAGTITVASIPQAWGQFQQTCGSNMQAGGCTTRENYMGTFVSGYLGQSPGTYSEGSIAGVQLYELGNALSLITGRETYDQGLATDLTTQSPGYKLQQCVLANNPGQNPQ